MKKGQKFTARITGETFTVLKVVENIIYTYEDPLVHITKAIAL